MFSVSFIMCLVYLLSLKITAARLRPSRFARTCRSDTVRVKTDARRPAAHVTCETDILRLLCDGIVYDGDLDY